MCKDVIKKINCSTALLLTQFPPPIILLGDFNAHSMSWGCSNNESKGKMIEDLLLQHNLSRMNDGSATYLSSASGSQSAIDVSMCDPYYSWKVHDDLCGNDHFPIEIHCDFASSCQRNCSWKLCKADWNTFSDKGSS